ncbi:MAG: hypothetical protein ACRDZN_09920 [Acidimicrobiales bacterium]
MSEIGDLIAILGEIDRTVGADEHGEAAEKRSQVAALVPAYREPDRFGWFDGFVAANELELPSLDEAMRNLAQPTRFASMLPRRLLAVALAVRMFPEQFGPGREGEGDALRALVVPGIVAGLPPIATPPHDEPPEPPGIDDTVRGQARDLLAALADPGELPTIEAWRDFVTRQHDAGRISAQLASLPAPCTVTVLELRREGDPDAIAVLQTRLCVRGVDIATLAAGFLDPTRWPQCSPWWCAMELAPGGGAGLTRYLEVVALACPGVLEVAVFLDFATPVDSGTRKVVTYKLSPDQGGTVAGFRANGAVNVDQGTIELRQEQDHVHVETTKRVRFTRLVDAQAIAVLACWVGYGDFASDLVCDCSGGRPEAVDCEAIGPLAASAAPEATPIANAVAQLVARAQARLAEAGALAHSVAGRLDRDSYTSETAARDAARSAALAVRNLADVPTALAEAARTAARPSSGSLPPRASAFAFRSALVEDCDVELVGDLTSPYRDRIPKARVDVRPARLAAGECAFTLGVADPTDLDGSAFVGKAKATGVGSGAPAGSTDVYVIVP